MKYFILALLLLFCFFSALTSVYLKQQSRKHYQQLYHLEKQQDAMLVKWGQLQLERSTLASYNQVEDIAIKKLGMYYPLLEDIIFTDIRK